MGRTRSQKPSPAYREGQRLISWEPQSVYYIEDDSLGEMLDDMRSDTEMLPVDEIDLTDNTRKDQ